MSDYYTNDPPVSLDPKLIQSAIAIGSAGYTAYLAASWSSAYKERCMTPRPGDLVLETSSFGLRMRRDDHPEICLGILDSVVAEWVPYRFESEEEKEGLMPDELGYRETFTNIQLWVSPYPAQLTRWSNCTFIAIPQTPSEAYNWDRP